MRVRLGEISCVPDLRTTPHYQNTIYINDVITRTVVTIKSITEVAWLDPSLLPTFTLVNKRPTFTIKRQVTVVMNTYVKKCMSMPLNMALKSLGEVNEPRSNYSTIGTSKNKTTLATWRKTEVTNPITRRNAWCRPQVQRCPPKVGCGRVIGWRPPTRNSCIWRHPGCPPACR